MVLQKCQSTVFEAFKHALKFLLGCHGPVAFLESKELMIEFVSFTVGSGITEFEVLSF